MCDAYITPTFRAACEKFSTAGAGPRSNGRGVSESLASPPAADRPRPNFRDVTFERGGVLYTRHARKALLTGTWRGCEETMATEASAGGDRTSR